MERIDRAAVIASGLITVSTDHRAVARDAYQIAKDLERLEADELERPAAKVPVTPMGGNAQSAPLKSGEAKTAEKKEKVSA
jgi:hypothetical protein